MGRYDYEELVQAVKENENQETLMNLFLWFEEYGSAFWNGEHYYCADDLGRNLYPTYEEDENGEFEVTGAELR